MNESAMTDTKAMTLRVPTELHEELRREAFERRTSITAVALEAIRARQTPPPSNPPSTAAGHPSPPERDS